MAFFIGAFYGALGSAVFTLYLVVRTLRARLPERPVERSSGYPDELPPVTVDVHPELQRPPHLRIQLLQLAHLERATWALNPYGLRTAGNRGDQ